MVEVPTNHGTVVAISVDPQGQTLAALHESHRGLKLCCFWKRPDGSYRSRPEIGHRCGREALADADLADGSRAAAGGERRKRADRLRRGVGTGARATANRRRRIGRAAGRACCSPPAPEQAIGEPCDRAHARFDALGRARPGGRSALPDRLQLAAGGDRSACSRSRFPFRAGMPPPLLELVGVDRSGGVHAAEFHVDERSVELIASRGWPRPTGDTSGAAHCWNQHSRGRLALGYRLAELSRRPVPAFATRGVLAPIRDRVFRDAHARRTGGVLAGTAHPRAAAAARACG